MMETTMHTVLVSVFCPDRPGLVSAIAGRLFDLGANLGDASFTVLGTGAEFTALSHLPGHVGAAELKGELLKLPELRDATVTVKGFGLDPGPSPSALITHVVTVSGGDRPGLVARLAEVFAGFKANIVRMDAQTLPDGGHGRYVIRFSLSIPAASAATCLATVDSTAGEMGLACAWTEEAL
jgi:glycine cleavage system transcriptional repressor